ncbi:hypothetical protein [Cupriavidus taiwanensis]|uniref:hypothetical protein n=1 Tax=Cupriavidus taiwanensis TaxID=164546 RepID=UPI0011AE2BAB|nr:hypothetical protein [Cupriavidus taiwanensis]
MKLVKASPRSLRYLSVFIVFACCHGKPAMHGRERRHGRFDRFPEGIWWANQHITWGVASTGRIVLTSSAATRERMAAFGQCRDKRIRQRKKPDTMKCPANPFADSGGVRTRGIK